MRRLKLSAHIVTGPDGFRHTELFPEKTIDKVISQPTLIPLEDAKKDLEDLILSTPIAPARKGERQGASRLVDAFVEGLGNEAQTVLGGYLDRAGSGLIELINREYKRFTAKPAFAEVVELIPLAPVRAGRPQTSTDRIGDFKKSVGYTGWKSSIYGQVWFDSKTERTLASLLDDADEIHWWMRLHIGELPILWSSAGSFYNPDFIAIEADDTLWVVEVKADKDMESGDVKGKGEAAQRWANHVSADEEVKVEWRYLLASETDIAGAKGSWAALKASSGL